MKIEEQTNTYQDAARLVNVRFNEGVTSFLEVLITQQQYFHISDDVGGGLECGDAKLRPVVSGVGRRIAAVAFFRGLPMRQASRVQCSMRQENSRVQFVQQGALGCYIAKVRYSV
jgi:hypothetical protein